MHDHTSTVFADATRDDQMDHGRHRVAEAVHRQRGPVTRRRIRARPQARLDHILERCRREITKPIHPMRTTLHYTRGREPGELLTSHTGLDRLVRTEPAVARFSNPKQRTPTRWHKCHHIVDEHARASPESSMEASGECRAQNRVGGSALTCRVVRRCPSPPESGGAVISGFTRVSAQARIRAFGSSFANAYATSGPSRSATRAKARRRTVWSGHRAASVMSMPRARSVRHSTASSNPSTMAAALRASRSRARVRTTSSCREATIGS